MRQFVYPNNEFVTSQGAPSVDWTLSVYDTGTSNLASIYSDAALTVPAANPITADSNGFFATFFWSGTIDLTLKDDTGNTINSVTEIVDFVTDVESIVFALNSSLPFGIATGSGDAIGLTLTISGADFSDGDMLLMRANAANTTTVTLTVNSLPVRAVKKIGGEALIANDIRANQNCILMYNLAQDCYYLINHEATFLRRDGSLAMLSDLNMGSHKITSLIDGAARSDAAVVGQIQDGSVIYGAAGGAANALTLTLTPAVTAYVAGQRFYFKATADNTGAATLAANGLSALPMKRIDGLPLQPKDLLNGSEYIGIYDGTNVQVINAHAVGALANGNCQLVIDGANLRLNPRNGNQLLVGGIGLTIPSAGVALSTSGTAPSTKYYVYAQNSGGSIVLAANATGYAADADFGYYTKSGDVLQTLVGMAWTNSGGSWALVRSLYNDTGSSATSYFTANRSTNQTVFTELNSEIRTGFLLWSGEIPHISFSGGAVLDLGGGDDGYAFLGVSFDAGTVVDGCAIVGGTTSGGLAASDWVPIGTTLNPSGLTEGYHYASIYGKYVNTAGANCFVYAFGSGTAGQRTTLTVNVQR